MIKDTHEPIQLHIPWARLPEHNLQRFFNIFFGHNLFGDLYITVNNGRIGSRGRTRDMLCKDESELRQVLRKMVWKRTHAEKRIGCNYHIRQTTLEQEQLQQLTEPKNRNRKTAWGSVNIYLLAFLLKEKEIKCLSADGYDWYINRIV